MNRPHSMGAQTEAICADGLPGCLNPLGGYMVQQKRGPSEPRF